MRTFYGRRYGGIKRYKDRHGKIRTYYRPTSTELPDPDAVKFRVFDQAYRDALAGKRADKKPPTKPISGPATVEKAVREYFSSDAFKKLAPDTQTGRRSLLNSWVADHGDKELATFSKTNVAKSLENRTPTRGKNWFYAVRALIEWCIKEKKYGVKTDVTQGVKLKPVEIIGWKSWTEADVAQFVRRWPKGTMQYLALMILLSWGQRRSDVVKFGWHMIEPEGGIRFIQQKTGRRMLLPLTSFLAEVLPPRPDNVVELKPTPFLLTTPSKGTPRPFSGPTFTRWFGEACEAAGLPELSPHGTRKLAVQRVYRNALRAGRTDAVQITMAFSGHRSEKQLRVYLGQDFEQEEYAGELGAFMR